jgi:hypothetical protein
MIPVSGSLLSWRKIRCQDHSTASVCKVDRSSGAEYRGQVAPGEAGGKRHSGKDEGRSGSQGRVGEQEEKEEREEGERVWKKEKETDRGRRKGERESGGARVLGRSLEC